ncbi:hypothetical protein [Stenotrophomonas maltophilia]|uniref:hypothetical protein n=1 Tax=Stenotrophomonas maltophilia TaxID=40324 RepID=UPI0025553CF6|nr:hypothetical protein [Stenotrophomonas maltophilia]
MAKRPILMNGAMVRASLAGVQPGGRVGQIDEAAVLRRAAAVLDMWEGDSNQTGYMGDFKDACNILELLAQHAAPPTQAVDLPYSLDADPAGIRARVADVITGTLMVGAQSHTPPPAGHWAQPFWQAARHDAARSLNVALKLRELVAASKYMRDRVVETRGVKCMDDLDYAIDEAEKALSDSQAEGRDQ